MCNLSEGVFEKGKFEQLVDIVKKMMSKGMNFDEIIKLLDLTPEKASLIKNAIGI